MNRIQSRERPFVPSAAAQSSRRALAAVFHDEHANILAPVPLGACRRARSRSFNGGTKKIRPIVARSYRDA